MSPSICESKGIKRMNKIITNDIDVKYFFKPPTFGRLIRMVYNSKEFYEIFNWRWNKHRRKYVLDSVLHKQAVKEFFKLIENKQRRTWPWVYRQDQKRGNYYSLPSLYSAVNPQENFAENLTHYYLDTNYESYSSFEQIDFFDRLFL